MMFVDDFDRDNNFPFRYCIEGKLFNLRRLQAKTNVQPETDVLVDLLYPECQPLVKNAKGN